jgi:hypothetical protein
LLQDPERIFFDAAFESEQFVPAKEQAKRALRN